MPCIPLDKFIFAGVSTKYLLSTSIGVGLLFFVFIETTGSFTERFDKNIGAVGSDILVSEPIKDTEKLFSWETLRTLICFTSRLFKLHPSKSVILA